jgi:hypothetical protein
VLNTYYQDADADGYGNPSSPINACNAPAGYLSDASDCNDGDFFIKPGFAENTAPGYCADGKDNDCNFRADYDGFSSGTISPPRQGDVACPVRLLGISAPPSVGKGGSFTLQCTTNAQVRSITTSISPSGSCAFAGWSGNVASFTCSGMNQGLHSVWCHIDTFVSTRGSPDLSTTVDVGDCDSDADGYNKSIITGIGEICTSTLPFDCNDANAAVNPGVTESGAMCTNNVDDDCDGDIDYDGGTALVHGDDGCPIQATALKTFSPACAGSAGFTLLNCTYNVASRSAIANISRPGSTQPCTLLRTTGTVAEFQCDTTPPFAAGDTATLVCSVDPAIAYQAPPNLVQNVALNAPGQVCDGGNGVCNWRGICTDAVQWLGNLTDMIYGARIPAGTRANVTVDGVIYPADSGIIDVLGIRLGLHNITAVAAGYERTVLPNINFSTDPFYYNVQLLPITCKSDCTFGGLCDYTCLGKNGCEVNTALSAQEWNNVTQICQFSPVNNTRDFNSTHVVNCCMGPIQSESVYRAPLAVESCAEHLVPHRMITLHDGKIVQVTVMTYKRCE